MAKRGGVFSEGGKKAGEYCKKFPSMGSLTLAKKLYKEFPLFFKDVEHARSLIRHRRGKTGDTHREKATEIIPTINRENPFNLPESFAETWEALEVSQSRTLIISDLHFPYQDNKAITCALNYGLEKDVNCIIINGDLIDFHTISRFDKEPNKRSIVQEFEATRQFLKSLRDNFPKARIIFKEGNHDERWEKWLFLKAPEIFDDEEFRLSNRLKLGELQIEHLGEKRPIKLGKLNILHGHELQGSGGVNPARATFMKTISNMLIGHCHRSSSHTEPTFGGDVIVTTSMGCLCGMFPSYARVNKWNQGFAYVELDIKTGNYQLSNLKIINGMVCQ